MALLPQGYLEASGARWSISAGWTLLLFSGWESGRPNVWRCTGQCSAGKNHLGHSTNNACHWETKCITSFQLVRPQSQCQCIYSHIQLYLWQLSTEQPSEPAPLAGSIQISQTLVTCPIPTDLQTYIEKCNLNALKFINNFLKTSQAWLTGVSPVLIRVT